MDVTPLISHRYALDDAAQAYDLVARGAGLGIVLTYPDRGGAAVADAERVTELRQAARTPSSSGRDPMTAAAIGAGGHARRVLLPAMQHAGFRLKTVVSGAGTSALVAAEQFDAERAATDAAAALEDGDVATVFVLTRHDTHAAYAVRALDAGLNTFVEKPLALTHEDLNAVAVSALASDGILTVGYNRRFAPLTRQLQRDVEGRAGPVSLIITVNAGSIPADHWTQDPVAGGGRIAGEACHFIDLARAIAGHPIRETSVTVARTGDGMPIDDVAHIMLAFEDGSTAVSHYLASGARAFAKERVEAFVDGRTFVIDNWRRMRRYGVTGPIPRVARRQDKGHAAQQAAWASAVKTGTPPIPYDELFEVARATLEVAAAAAGRPHS